MRQSCDNDAGSVRSPGFRRLSVCILAASIPALMMACGETNGVGPETPPLAGTLNVIVKTTGGDFDTDGYELVLDSDKRFKAKVQEVITLGSLPAGSHQLALEGVADNCVVVGGATRSVVIASAAMSADFEVACEPTGIVIQLASHGVDFPFQFNVAIGSAPSLAIAPLSGIAVTRLRPGSYPVALSVPGQCSVNGPNPLNVDVVNRTLKNISFDITCRRVEKRIAFIEWSSATNGRIHASDETGAELTYLVDGSEPSWSPNGNVAFARQSCGPGGFYDYYCSGTELMLIDPDSRLRTITVYPHKWNSPAWSSDGKDIAFVQESFFGSTLVLLNRKDSVTTKLDVAATKVSNPSWSPDGARLVFGCWSQDIGSEICRINRDGTGFVRLTSGNSAAPISYPRWSPDGNRIAFVSRVKQPGSSYFDIALMSPDGSNVTRLVSGSSADWSPDGSRLVFAGSDGLFTVRADGTDVKRLTTGLHQLPVWKK